MRIQKLCPLICKSHYAMVLMLRHSQWISTYVSKKLLVDYVSSNYKSYEALPPSADARASIACYTLILCSISIQVYVRQYC